jgi:hypothetical protein
VTKVTKAQLNSKTGGGIKEGFTLSSDHPDSGKCIHR